MQNQSLEHREKLHKLQNSSLLQQRSSRCYRGMNRTRSFRRLPFWMTENSPDYLSPFKLNIHKQVKLDIKAACDTIEPIKYFKELSENSTIQTLIVQPHTSWTQFKFHYETVHSSIYFPFDLKEEKLLCKTETFFVERYSPNTEYEWSQFFFEKRVCKPCYFPLFSRTDPANDPLFTQSELSTTADTVQYTEYIFNNFSEFILCLYETPDKFWCQICNKPTFQLALFSEPNQTILPDIKGLLTGRAVVENSPVLFQPLNYTPNRGNYFRKLYIINRLLLI